MRDGTLGSGAPTDQAISVRLRRQYGAKMRGFTSQTGGNVEALRDLTLHVAVAAIAAAASWAWILRNPTGWIAYPVFAFLIGTRLRAVGNMLHEASHAVLVPRRRHNVAWGHLLAILDFAQFDVYTHEHLTHHRHLGDPERDLDFLPRQRYGFCDPSRPFVTSHVLRPLTLFHVPSFLKPVLFHPADSWAVRAGRLVHIGLLAVLAHVVGLVPFVLYAIVPYVAFYQIIRYWSDALDHAGALQQPDEFYRARNHVFRIALLNWLLFPRCDQYHLTHHLFPAVPVKRQAAAHEMLMDAAEYAIRGHRVRDVLREAAGRPAVVAEGTSGVAASVEAVDAA